ncbi:helix-turn-helix domain-containing protein [Halomarina halobia]|uniref:Helix-turn-helix domain-containing protein n=1 Tax=Halomarina halobia TaxID=3033386 RepID=A0ABD6A4U5_9EURY|nr:helix-turn-helix domain-containing protein [Halomarina sp. PSR21]
MAVIGEVALPPNSFPLGTLLTADRDLHIEFERVVPIDDGVLPILWAWGGDMEAFERRLRRSDDVSAFTLLQRVDGRSLYSVTWSSEATGFIDGLAATEALILRAHGHDDDSWDFRLLFSSHEKFSSFHNFCHDLDLTYTLGRVHALSEAGLDRPAVTLTDEQREALQLALEGGYFDIPSRVTLTELARELGISQQALSQRIRRGNRAILEQVLVGTPSDAE